MKTKGNEDESAVQRTINIRLPEAMIDEINELRVMINLKPDPLNIGHTSTRSDVVRTVLRYGIDATKKMLDPPPPKQPLESKPKKTG
jgi:hypothetical protein